MKKKGGLWKVGPGSYINKATTEQDRGWPPPDFIF
jgi:hypothetical protein